MAKEINIDLDQGEFDALSMSTPAKPVMVVTDLAPKAGDTLICWGPEDKWAAANVLGSKRMEWDTVIALAKKR